MDDLTKWENVIKQYAKKVKSETDKIVSGEDVNRSPVRILRMYPFITALLTIMLCSKVFPSRFFH